MQDEKCPIQPDSLRISSKNVAAVISLPERQSDDWDDNLVDMRKNEARELPAHTYQKRADNCSSNNIGHIMNTHGHTRQ